MSKWIFIILLPFLSGCQVTYLIKSASSQADILRRRVPLDEALKDPTLGDEEKRKLRLAEDARRFAETRLSLKPTKNYTSFVKLDGPYVTYVVSAAPKNELKSYVWKYPLVGAMPYRGFFNREDALAEAETLKKKGLDTHVRGVTAYSTLGWFRDPILSSMLAYKDHDLVNTIIHETVHATVFIKSEADFNERLASYVGNRGTEIFYATAEGPSSATLALISRENADEKIFSEFISNESEALKRWYEERKERDIPESEREARLKEIQTRFEIEARPLMATTAYRDFASVNLNNARLLLYQLYMKDLSDFDHVFVALGRDFSKLVKFCKQLESQDDPEAYLKRVVSGIVSGEATLGL